MGWHNLKLKNSLLNQEKWDQNYLKIRNLFPSDFPIQVIPNKPEKVLNHSWFKSSENQADLSEIYPNQLFNP